MGDEEYFTNMIIEHLLVHNFENIYSCNLHDLLTRKGDTPEVNSLKIEGLTNRI
jgi:hypothetical protein